MPLVKNKMNLKEIKIEDILKKTDNLFIIAIVLIGLIISVNIIKKNANAYKLLQQKIKTEENMSNLLTEINDSAKDYNYYQKKILFDKDSRQVVNAINEWASASGVEIISLTPQFVKGDERFYYVPVDLVAKADYYGLGLFLSRIEDYEGFIEIRNLKVSAEGGRIWQSMQSQKLNINLSLYAVALKELDVSEAFSRY
ncbi:MAG: type 4a pilus biogenesis protein PilO [Candidatus Omnitrophica bacterium]|nr:type 4a pilus biogenesis protein PilO [Candidatus Omnitrophota bacterium]